MSESTNELREALPGWMVDALSLDAGGRRDAALDVLYGEADAMLRAGRFAELDDVVADVPVDAASPTFLVGVLSITLPAAERMPRRDAFYERVRAALGDGGDAILGGLRRWQRT